MIKEKVSAEERAERKRRADDWKQFRRDRLITQRKLAERLGVSRRTIQQIEAARVTPHISTIRLFDAFRHKYDRESKV